MNHALLEKRIREQPLMEPADAVKLLYQSEFGCGHLLAAEGICAARIAEEIAQTGEDALAEPVTEIGGGLCRMNLRAPAARRVAPELIARMMRHTAGLARGSVENFEKKLDALRDLCRRGGTPFGPDALESYLSAYAREGYPPAGHSRAYRRAYAPAYRVVLRGYGDLLELIAMAQARQKEAGRAIVALDGDCGAGKTTLAGLMAPLFEAAILPMDDFFLPAETRTAQRLAEPGGNIHYERFAEEILRNLAHGRAFSYTRYDCATGGWEPRSVRPSDMTIIEGSYSHHPFFSAAYEELGVIRAFAAVSEEEQRKRLSRRNPALLPRFQREWIPLEKTYFQAYHIVEKADVTIVSLPWEEDGP